MLERVLRTIRTYQMVRSGDNLAAAVSGGADSVCLLLVLKELASELGIVLSAVHINHGLRGAESDGDEAFVRDLAGRLDVPVAVEKVQIPAGENLEQAARDARRRVFRSLAVDRVATGHTRSDQAETVLYRLIRGAGTAGLSGVLPVTDNRIVRPLLECSRADAEAFLRGRGQAWREDRTNVDRVFARNRIRHELLPLLAREFNPGVADVLAATAQVARDEEEYWRAELDDLAARLFTVKPGAVLVRADDLMGVHVAVRRRLVRRAVAAAKGDLRGIDLLHIERILHLANQAEGHGRTQAPGIDVFRSFEWMRIAIPQTQTRFQRDYAYRIGTDSPKFEVTLPESRIFLEIQHEPSLDGYTGTGDELDLGRVVGPLELRNWHPGDEFQPPGRSRQKIKALFGEARVPLWERHGWPVLTSGSGIVWTRAYGAAEGFLPGEHTRNVLRIIEYEAEFDGHPPKTDESRESKQPV